MKFGKCLYQTIEDIPTDWRPFAIQYKKLKKCIHKIVQELDNKGISRNIILDAAERYKMEYSFDENPIHIRPYIKLDMAPDSQLFHPLTEHHLESIQSEYYSRSVSSIPSLPSTDSSDTESTSDSHDDFNADITSIYNDNFINTKSTNQLQRTMFIELETDGEFFNTLLEEISQLNQLQRQNRDEYMDKVNKLCNILIKATSPYKKDMYAWREIFQLYLKAEIFIGTTEADRDERDWKSAQKQLKWFSDELTKMKLPRKLKLKSSKEAFREFLKINHDLVAMKQFQDLNQTATSKILKKHDKRTCLNASPNFKKLLENDPYFNENMGKSLCCLMNKQLSTVTPQLEDHTCPVCTSIYWKPIRLCCGHVFCVRCIIKAERKGMRNCPICRFEDAMVKSSTDNLDIPLQNFIKLYFPREVEVKRDENGREEAGEEIEMLMGQQFSGDACRIM